MGVNKVEFGNTVIVDMTSVTVSSETLLAGYTALDRSGNLITGTAIAAIFYDITNNLIDCLTDNQTTRIKENLEYTATLSTESSDYIVGSVSITMGGIDITSSAYNSSNGTISISHVTGNLVITAVGEENLEPIPEFAPTWLRKGYQNTTIPRVAIGSTQADLAVAASEMPDVVSVIAVVNSSYWTSGLTATVRTRTSGYSYTNHGITRSIQTLTVNGVMYAVVTFTKNDFIAAYQNAIDDITNNNKIYADTYILMGNVPGRFVTTNNYWVIAEEVTENVIKRLPS